LVNEILADVLCACSFQEIIGSIFDECGKSKYLISLGEADAVTSSERDTSASR